MIAPAAARRRGDGGAAVLRQGFAELYGGGGGVGEGEGGARAMGAQPPSPALLYIGLFGGGAGPGRSNLPRGRRPGRFSSPPKPSRRCLIHLGLLLDGTLGAWALWGWFPLAQTGQGAPPKAHVAHRGRWPHLVDPRDPSGGPGTIPITPKLVPMAKTALPIYNSLPPDHSGTPRDVRDLIRDSEQHSGYCIYISLQP